MLYVNSKIRNNEAFTFGILLIIIVLLAEKGIQLPNSFSLINLSYILSISNHFELYDPNNIDLLKIR